VRRSILLLAVGHLRSEPDSSHQPRGGSMSDPPPSDELLPWRNPLIYTMQGMDRGGTWGQTRQVCPHKPMPDKFIQRFIRSPTMTCLHLAWIVRQGQILRTRERTWMRNTSRSYSVSCGLSPIQIRLGFQTHHMEVAASCGSTVSW
jgi:hypothetical protein